MAIADAHSTGWADLGETAGGSIKGPVNAAACLLNWQGSTLGLRKAYKQGPLSDQAQALCVLGYFYGGGWKYYTTSRMPFWCHLGGETAQ